MVDDKQELVELNTRISEAENRGDREWLASILAPRMAFQRADAKKTVDDQSSYIDRVGPAERGSERRVLGRISPIHLYGDRAIVECVIAVGEKEFHNLRVFVKRDGSWKLLAWANEPV